jgi:hypothetical protein
MPCRVFVSYPIAVIAGLVPVIPLRRARPCLAYRDGRDKPGHADGGAGHSVPVIAGFVPAISLRWARCERKREVIVVIYGD